MKNLSVGKKFGIGFGLLIALMVIVLVVSLVTGIQRNNQLDAVKNYTDMQTEANYLLDEENAARIELLTVFTAIENNEEYDKAMSLLQSASGRVETLEEYATRLSADEAAIYQGANAALRQEFSDLTGHLENIHANDASLMECLANMNTAGETMATSSTELVGLVENLLDSRLETEPDMIGYRLTNVLYPVIALSEKIDAMHILNEKLALNYDSSIVPEINQMLESVEADVASLQQELITGEGRAAAQEVADGVTAYRKAVEIAATTLVESDELIMVARASLDELTSVVNTGIASINQGVTERITELTTTSNFVNILLTALIIIATVFSVLSAVVLTRMFTRPLGMMQEVMNQVGNVGDLNFTEETRNSVLKEAEAKDEIGQSLKTFAQLIDRIRYVGGCMESIAGRDLSIDVELLSDKDTMGNALKTMVDNLNNVFTEINSAASQVATASSEISQGAQALAQGSTEQASTVEEISASINEINEQMHTSTDTARQSAHQAQEINQIAKDGNDKMTHLSGSMHEISEASQSIGNVIKVIDDIAFQTNILALNAAVEAARAGEHGKGFAVVADEVRNLAGKSADAAKETAALISANIEKTEQGMTYTTETADSLAQIMQGIESTNQSLQLVAEQAEGAKMATSQVNLAIDQVAQVVQQNSATSEESAAASEEMSSQAQVLQQLIAQFKLRGQDGAGYRALPQAVEAENEYEAKHGTSPAAVIF